MSDSTEIVKQLREACVGHPAAKIPWPHRLLHDAADQLQAQEREIEAIRSQETLSVTMSDRKENIVDNPKSWAAWKQEAERVGAELQAQKDRIEEVRQELSEVSEGAQAVTKALNISNERIERDKSRLAGLISAAKAAIAEKETAHLLAALTEAEKP